VRLQSGQFAKQAADVDSVFDYARALNPFAVAMEAPAGERMSRQLGGWARGVGGGALGGLLGGIGGQELGALAGGAYPDLSGAPIRALNELGAGLDPAAIRTLAGRHGQMGLGSTLGSLWDKGLAGTAGTLMGAASGAIGGAPAGAAVGGLRGHVGAIRAARAARLEQQSLANAAREALEQAASSGGGALSGLAERAMAAARKNPLVAGAGLGLAGATALS
jgi:hypothetical protein